MSANLVKSAGFVPLAVDQTTFLVRINLELSPASANVLKGLLWGCVGVSFLFVIFRAYVRWSVFQRFFADDAFVLLAWVLLLTNTSIWQKRSGLLYLVFDVETGSPPPPTFLSSLVTFLHAGFAVVFLQLCGLWAIKLSFLVFFRKLIHNVTGILTWWWCVLIVTVAGWVLSVGIQEYECTFASIDQVAGEHKNAPPSFNARAYAP